MSIAGQNLVYVYYQTSASETTVSKVQTKNIGEALSLIRKNAGL